MRSGPTKDTFSRGTQQHLKVFLPHEASFKDLEFEAGLPAQTWGVLEARAGKLARARELFQQGVWAQPGNRNVSRVWQVAPRRWSLLPPFL